MLDRLRTTLERRWSRWLLFLSAIAVIVMGALLIELRRIRDDLESGRELLTRIELATVADEGGLTAIADRAVDRLDAAADRAQTSPVLRLLSVVPGLSPQVDAVRDLTRTVADLGTEGRAAAAGIEDALAAGSGPEGRLTVVRAARDEMLRLRAVLDGVELERDGWLLPQVDDARRSLVRELADAGRELDRSAALASALERFLEGPRRYLVLGGNNAEMRAVGIPTTSGIAQIADGAIDVGDFSGATDGIELPEPGVPVPLAYEAIYGWLNGDRGYRTTVATANWPVAARIAADITASNQYGPVDGIIYVDTTTLAVLLAVIGPVEVDGVEYTFDNVLDELLYRNYLRFDTLEDNPERKALQSEIAQAIFDDLDTREYDVLELAGRLSELARGRHLLAWSEDPDENALWEAFGADGALAAEGVGVVSQDLGASKLDYFVRQAVTIEADDRGDHRRVTLHVTLTNPEHPETSPYIEGGGVYASPGEYGSFLVSYLPGEAYNISSEPTFTHHGRDGPAYAVGTILRVPEGTTREVDVTFSLPARIDALTVMPSARLYGTVWTVDDVETVDQVPFDIDLTAID
jgi:hypothetical protein